MRKLTTIRDRVIECMMAMALVGIVSMGDALTDASEAQAPQTLLVTIIMLAVIWFGGSHLTRIANETDR